MYRNGEGRWENWFICLDGYLLPIKKKKKKKALSESENETQSMDNVLKQVCTGINAAKANVIMFDYITS